MKKCQQGPTIRRAAGWYSEATSSVETSMAARTALQVSSSQTSVGSPGVHQPQRRLAVWRGIRGTLVELKLLQHVLHVGQAELAGDLYESS